MFKLCLLLLPVVAMAQLTPNSVTVTASRTTETTIDQTSFYVSVDSKTEAGLDDILAAVRGAGLTMANFHGVSYSDSSYVPAADTQVTWYFSLSVPLTQMKATIGLLTGVRNSLDKDGKYSLTFRVSSITSSTQQGCSFADMITDARTSASKLAGAAGLSAGAILAISSPVLPPTGEGGVGGCSLTVKFALGGI
jgi:hypothetical protein